MKKLTYLILLLSILGFASCGSSGTDKESSIEKKEKKSDEIKNCDDFLAHYEEWVDEYIEVLDDYLKNPGDAIVATRYMELMQEAMEWSTKWVALADCADDEEYEKEFEEISQKIEDRLKELGVE
ncbi:MAG: hypothetical protein KOO66_05820 [Bacteroidales bacterium]|nr:hypothetical protein [Bacteroidales bacterium]